MKLFDLFNRLSTGEFSNLALGSEGVGDIREADKAKVLNYVNEGLLQLYSRFVLSTKSLQIEQVVSITNYHLISKYAETKDCVEYPYIKDLPGEPFEDDLIRILEVYDANGCLFPLNDPDMPNSLFTPALQILQVPRPRTGVPLYIMYQARCLPMTDFSEDHHFDLPFTLEAALQAYIAHKVYGNMNGQDNMLKSQDHFTTYERICQEVENKDLVNNTMSSSHHKLIQRGFV